MSDRLTDLNPVSRITIGAVGQPGQRVFLLQASQGSTMITLKLEKEQAKILAFSTLELLEELDEKYPRAFSKLDTPLSSDLMIHEPADPEFVIGQIGLGYDQEQDNIVLVAQEIQLEDTNPITARFWATRAQMKALSDHTIEIIEHGRPTCPLCDNPIDPDGHFCPRTNGHDKIKWH